MTQRRILICTVGGSDKPIVTALRAVPWDHVVFVCSDDSVKMLTDPIEGREPAATTRPPIPEQAALVPGGWSYLTVPSDDPDKIYTILIDELGRLCAGSPEPDITIDYTGGTKSMSVGAALAFTALPGLHLQVTTGQRSDLVRVVDGTQRATGLDTKRIVMDRQITMLRETWSRFGYQEAAEGFAGLLKEAEKEAGHIDEAMLGRLKFWAALGRGFAAWDRFDRKDALGALQHVWRKAGPDLRNFEVWSKALRSSATSSLALFDLQRNAERCAARGRYDDAVARCYRLWEWTVQWLLEAECGIRTDSVDPALLDAETLTGLQLDRNGNCKLGSKQSWDLYRKLFPTAEVTAFWDAANTKAYDNFGPLRNSSILAHGTTSIGPDHAKKILAWTAAPFMDMVRQAARRLNQPDDMPQLPSELPEPVLS